jgi:transcriptional regulator with XRE-family HTH domain
MENEVTRRLVELRGFLRLKQRKFARDLGIPQTTYSAIENGKNPLQERHIRLICLTFNVNETWLCTGEGAMFEEVAGWPEILSIFQKLSPEMRKAVLEMARGLRAAREKQRENKNVESP